MSDLQAILRSEIAQVDRDILTLKAEIPRLQSQMRFAEEKSRRIRSLLEVLEKEAPQLMLAAPDHQPETPTETVVHDVDLIEPPPDLPPAPSVVQPLAPPPAAKDMRHKTPERVALLRELWVKPGATRAEILDALNALPGGQIPAKNLGIYVIQWGIAKSAKDGPLATNEAAKSPSLADLSVQAEPYQPKPPVAVSFVAPAPPPAKAKPAAPIVAPNLGPPRLAKALTLPDPVNVPMEPIEADATTIRATADLWGIVFRGAVDLWAVNKAAEKRGARPFRLVETEQKIRRRHCMSCGTSFDSAGPHNRLCNPCSGKSTVAADFT